MEAGRPSRARTASGSMRLAGGGAVFLGEGLDAVDESGRQGDGGNWRRCGDEAGGRLLGDRFRGWCWEGVTVGCVDRDERLRGRRGRRFLRGARCVCQEGSAEEGDGGPVGPR